jgi:ribosomal protein L22
VATAAPERELVRAQAKWVRMSARKGRVVAEHIRGRSVPEARAVLAFTPRAAAREIEKVLSSAVANAEANNGLVGDELVVWTCTIDEGPTLKRWKARARGRVARIKKRTCHVTIALAPMEQALEVAPPRRKAPSPETAASDAAAEETTEEPKRTRKPAAKPAAAREKKTTAKTDTPASGRAKRGRKNEEAS